jgi:hypothetical protein
MNREFPYIKTEPDNHGKLGVDAGEIFSDDRVEGPHHGKLTVVFLGKITKGKYLGFHTRLRSL